MVGRAHDALQHFDGDMGEISFYPCDDRLNQNCTILGSCDNGVENHSTATIDSTRVEKGGVGRQFTPKKIEEVKKGFEAPANKK